MEIIVKKSPRELRERMAEAPRWAREQAAYARGLEEAHAYSRDVEGLDNPNRKGVLTDDGGRAAKELRDRTLRAHGRDPQEFE